MRPGSIGVGAHKVITMSGLTKELAFTRPVRGLCLALLMLGASAPAAQAALTVSATRVVFDSDKRSVSVIVTNPSNRPYAVQTWINTVTDDTTSPVPFVASPPLFRVNPGKEQQVQISGLPNDLPNDRESLFFFNVQEIPQIVKEDGNALNIALRTRLKLFYRPSEIKDSPMSRLKDLTWSFKRSGGKNRLIVTNPSPFHLTFARVEVSAAGKTEKLASVPMLEPLATQEYDLKDVIPSQGAQVLFTAINDYGGQSIPLTLPIQFTP